MNTLLDNVYEVKVMSDNKHAYRGDTRENRLRLNGLCLLTYLLCDERGCLLFVISACGGLNTDRNCHDLLSSAGFLKEKLSKMSSFWVDFANFQTCPFYRMSP